MVRMTAGTLKSIYFGLASSCRRVRRLPILLVALSSAVGWGGSALADAQLGNMICIRIAGTGYNFLIHSKTQVRCTFKGSVDAEQWYLGETGVALGIDLKWNKEERILFGILSSTVKLVPEGDFLSGKYGGVKADAALGVGAGVAVLLGGSSDTIALQPAVEGSTGIGVAAGLSYLNLEPDPLNKARLVTPHGSLLAMALYANYFDAAYKFYHRSDYEGSDHFSGKAITASSGTLPAPDAVTKWKLAELRQKEASAIRERVVTAIEDPTGKEIDAAKAQVNYDCWLRELASDAPNPILVACRDSMNAHLKVVETAVAEEFTENVLKQPSWYRTLFDTDSAELDKFGLGVVDEILARIGQLDSARVYVMGNTDRTGSTKYNLGLSEKRAESVKSTLVRAGVPAAWMTPVVFGEHNPASLSANPHNALNRRVDILVEPIKIKPSVIKEEAKKIR